MSGTLLLCLDMVNQQKTEASQPVEDHSTGLITQEQTHSPLAQCAGKGRHCINHFMYIRHPVVTSHINLDDGDKTSVRNVAVF
jgi:hypothetical protein